jgi:integrase
MATLFTKSERGRETRMLQVLVGGSRKTIRLGRLPQRAAERLCSKVEELAACHRMNQTPDTDLVAWLAGLDDAAHASLAAAGLAELRATSSAVPTLGRFIDKHIALKRGRISARSIELLEQTKARLVARFGSATLLHRVTPDGAADWRAAMLEDGLSEATVRLHSRNAKCFWNDALERELVAKNPFRSLPSAAVAAEREHYITAEDAEKVIATLPDHQWRLFFGLGRYAGLRLPSESHILEWQSVDWDQRRLTVYAPKTGATRVVPIVPRLMDLLKAAYATRLKGEERMVMLSANNLHRTVPEAIARAELTRWPDLFQALRRSCETDFATRFAPHVAAAWLGHGVAVSVKHYLQVPSAMLDQAAGIGSPPPKRRRHAVAA